MPVFRSGPGIVMPDGRVMGELMIDVMATAAQESVAPAAVHLVPLTDHQREILGKYAATQAMSAKWDAESAEQYAAGWPLNPRPPDFLPVPPRILAAREKAQSSREQEAWWNALALTLNGGGA